MNIKNIILKNEKKYNKEIIFLNMSPWKKKWLKDFFYSAKKIYILKNKEIKNFNDDFFKNKLIIHWGIDYSKEVLNLKKKFKIYIMEDGFIRSKNLGSDLEAPASLSIDSNGIHFNPEYKTDLENLLNEYKLTEIDLKNGKELLNLFLNNSISKYNSFDNNLPNIYKKKNIINKKKILIIGQVEDDASIRYGSPLIKSNLELIKLVSNRYKKEDNFIIYKPHPDVFINNRKGKVSEEELKKYCDYIDTTSKMADLLSLNNIEVHTITSLSGFESLIHKNKTYCYGIPFYSGWGLTEDYIIDNEAYKRRNKKRTLLEIFTISYIIYPLYFDYEKKIFTSPEIIINKISNQKNSFIYLFFKRKFLYIIRFFKKIRKILRKK